MGAKFRQPPFSVAEANIISKSITANGTYNASSDSADGYNPVTVTVPEKTIVSKSITANGTYNASSDSADGYNPVIVDVPTGGVTQIVNLTNNDTGSSNTSITLTLNDDIDNYKYLIFTSYNPTTPIVNIATDNILAVVTVDYFKNNSISCTYLSGSQGGASWRDTTITYVSDTSVNFTRTDSRSRNFNVFGLK